VANQIRARKRAKIRRPPGFCPALELASGRGEGVVRGLGILKNYFYPEYPHSPQCERKPQYTPKLEPFP